MKYIFPVYCDSVPVVNGQHTDSKCCSVMALVHAFGISFEEAQKATMKFGRNVHEGMAVNDLLLMLAVHYGVYGGCTYGYNERVRMLQELHFSIYDEYPKSKKGCTLETFMKENNKGTYIVFLKGHVTVVKDGKLVDYNRQKGAKRVAYSIKVSD